MNIWYLNHYAVPHSAGTPGRPYYLSKGLMKLGHQVTVICASTHHLRQVPADNNTVLRLISDKGAIYYHLPTRKYSGNGPHRFLNMLDYAKGVRKLGRKIKLGSIEKPDVLIVSCPHPLALPAALRLSKKTNAKVIYEVRDIWPLSIIELARVSKWHPFVLGLAWLERLAYRKADAVVSLLPHAKLYMASKGLSETKFNYISNGVHVDEWREAPDNLPSLHQLEFDRLKKESKTIILYAGAHGPPNALDQILDLAGIENSRDRGYHFVLIGDGVAKKGLMRRAEKEKITFVSFLPKVTKKQVISAMYQADICFISLKKLPVFRFGVSPNKLGDYFMAAKPVIYAIEAGNDPVKDAKAGISVAPYHPEELDNAITTLMGMTVAERDTLGKNGRRYALKNLDWQVLAKKYTGLCESIQ